MKQKYLLIALSILFFPLGECCVFAQLEYPIVGTYKSKSAQGMAIWDNTAYLFNDGGHCRVLDLTRSKVVREFDLATRNCHVNNACFGREYYMNSTTPVLYITETNGKRRCIVEDVSSQDTSIFVQAISFMYGTNYLSVWNWSVDATNGFLYALHNIKNNPQENNGIVNRVYKFKLPELSNGKDIVLTPKDALDSFDVAFPNGVQGGQIRDGYWYIATGLQEKDSGRYDAGRAIIVIDLAREKILKKINLTKVTVNEPEGIDFYKDSILLYCGQNGGIYKVAK